MAAAIISMTLAVCAVTAARPSSPSMIGRTQAVHDGMELL